MPNIEVIEYIENTNRYKSEDKKDSCVQDVINKLGLSLSAFHSIEVIEYMENTNRYKSEDKKVNKAPKLINKLALSLSQSISL